MFTKNDLALASSVASGAGLGCMPDFFAELYPHLKRIKIKGEDEILGRHLNQKFIVYPVFLKNSERHKTFISFIKKKAQNLVLNRKHLK